MSEKDNTEVAPWVRLFEIVANLRPGTMLTLSEIERIVLRIWQADPAATDLPREDASYLGGFELSDIVVDQAKSYPVDDIIYRITCVIMGMTGPDASAEFVDGDSGYG